MNNKGHSNVLQNTGGSSFDARTRNLGDSNKKIKIKIKKVRIGTRVFTTSAVAGFTHRDQNRSSDNTKQLGACGVPVTVQDYGNEWVDHVYRMEDGIQKNIFLNMYSRI
jgi:hypothetical protein